ELFRSAQRAKGFHGTQVHGTQRPRVIDMSQDVHEERRRPLVTDEADGLHDRLSGLWGAVGARWLERAVSRIRSYVEHGPNGFALNLQLRVVEQEGELRQRFAAAELAQQVNCRSPDDGILRALQALDGLPSRGTERNQQRCQPLPGANPFLHGKRLGKWTDDDLADRLTDRFGALECLVIDRG